MNIDEHPGAPLLDAVNAVERLHTHPDLTTTQRLAVRVALLHLIEACTPASLPESSTGPAQRLADDITHALTALDAVTQTEISIPAAVAVGLARRALRALPDIGAEP